MMLRPFHPVDPDGDGGSVLRNYPLTARIALTVTAAAALLLALMAVPATRDAVQRVDDGVYSFLRRVRWTPVVWLGLVFDFVGGALFTVPLRAAMALGLAVKRRWWFLSMFGLAELTSELLNRFLKIAYGRQRPPDPLVHTSGHSFPSGHAIAATVIALTLVTLFVSPGPRRRRWWIGAIVFTLLMAASRAYLHAHWLSDALGGVLIGSACALDSALLVQGWRDRTAVRKLVEEPAVREEPEEMPAEGPLETKASDDAASR